MTLKTVLKNFLNYADTLEAQKKLGKDLYEIDFQKLKALTEELKHDKDYATSEGLKEVNRRKNRYKDILPYDYTRVILSEYPGVPGSDYINANYIKGASGSLAYIASQGPLPNTVVDFWRMIWECEIQVIVMACNEQESGKYKCECYWPTDDEKKQYGNINVEFVKWRQVCPDFLVRTLKACWESEERVICQFHYTTWPDHGVPNSVQPILELVRLIRDCQASEAVPVLVHCSAGCGRTGTICAIDFVWGLMRMGKLTKNFNLFNVIADMRRQRIAMVQTKEQYVLVHKAVSSLFEQQLRVIDSHTYENLDEDGEPLILKELHKEEDIYEDILDPPLEDNFILEEKQAEMKKLSMKSLQESSFDNKDSCLVTPKKESYLDFLSHTKKIPHSEIRNDSNSGETKSSLEMSKINQQENDKLDPNSKDMDSDNDLPYTKNSRTLQKLCREESVKRLISGWNKAAEHTGDLKMSSKENYSESQNFKTSMSKKHLDNYAIEQKAFQSVDSATPDQMLNQKVERAPFPTDNKPDDQLPHETSKTSSPEDMRAGKLVGKATVIRRPSIAKLKALFEKSSQGNVESSDSNRQRRTLFRSHSHYVSQSSRAFTVSDGRDQSAYSNQSTESSYVSSKDENSAIKEVGERKIYFERSRNNNVQNSSSSPFYEKSSENVKHDCNPNTGETKQRISEKSPSSFTDNRNSGLQVNASNNIPNESFSNSESYFNFDVGEAQHSKTLKKSAQKKEKVPELPIKKKHPAPLPQLDAIDKNVSENTVPRFQININKNNTLSQKEVDLNKARHQTDIPYKGSIGSKGLLSNYQDCNSEESLREYRRHSQEMEKKVLHKNQSFSDPEQGSARNLEMSKQILKPKSSLTDQTYPKFTYSGGKTASDDKLPSAYESTYMNVNSLAQKNIRQIEDKLKNHPRGAIIDLTSRKSYVDEMSVNTEKHFVFRNTSQPVKILQSQESRDLTPQEKCSINKTDNSIGISSSKANSKIIESKSENTKNDSDHINSKNLLLHSPPPKSKRGHLSKTNSKSPISPPTNVSDSVNDSSSNINTVAPSQQGQTKQINPKTLQAANFSLVSSPPNLNVAVSNTSTTVDRSDPRYFPVNRQTASDAKYESEKHKALTRERERLASSHPGSHIYETLYSVKASMPIYQKLPVAYEKCKPENYERLNQKMLPKDSKYSQENSKVTAEKEPLYSLQRSTSGPQILPSVPDPVQKGSDLNKSLPAEISKPPHCDQNPSYRHSSGQVMFPPGPPKPPRTFHYDQERVPVSETYKTEQSINRDGGRYIVTVASPKHSNQYVNITSPRSGPVLEYRYTDGRIPDHNSVNAPHQYAYVPQPVNEVHMSRSYPFTNYDNVYSHPRPYGKQFYPESVAYRNVQPVTRVNSNVYSTVKEQPRHAQDIYGTVKHRNTFSDYENVYDAQIDYLRAMSNTHTKNEYQTHHQSTTQNSVQDLQYSQSDANVYGVVQAPSAHSHLSKSSHVSGKTEYQNTDENIGNVSSPKRVYFDTLQRKHKQHVSWEQRRSHDDMDIRPAPSARLREQIHARRSMVELDNLEISVASDDGYSEKNVSEGSISSPEPLNKMTNMKNERYIETAQAKFADGTKELHHKKGCSHNKEPTSFGETLSKAFGRLTSLTKFNVKETQSNSPNTSESSSSSKVAKPKDKHQNFTLQSPANSTEAPSEQWTQV
ncbi:tyrosine-protein phosphatase non-receptor type 12 [Trichonephila clavata]|uniref:protein-tyrosine-phosphatase n=1 Tax=Trichonephila clavata TaxID=2740835 RepID=A0A8X6HYX4_TRICU|nr:tyrosine-protein phosphatase non-receptor type 12 [Trichonephila clavata]